jgi:hypothetical protein
MFTGKLDLNHFGIQSAIWLTYVFLLKLRYHKARYYIILVISCQLGYPSFDPLSYHVYANL